MVQRQIYEKNTDRSDMNQHANHEETRELKYDEQHAHKVLQRSFSTNSKSGYGFFRRQAEENNLPEYVFVQVKLKGSEDIYSGEIVPKIDTRQVNRSTSKRETGNEKHIYSTPTTKKQTNLHLLQPKEYVIRTVTHDSGNLKSKDDSFEADKNTLSTNVIIDDNDKSVENTPPIPCSNSSTVNRNRPSIIRAPPKHTTATMIENEKADDVVLSLQNKEPKKTLPNPQSSADQLGKPASDATKCSPSSNKRNLFSKIWSIKKNQPEHHYCGFVGGYHRDEENINAALKTLQRAGENGQWIIVEWKNKPMCPYELVVKENCSLLFYPIIKSGKAGRKYAIGNKDKNFDCPCQLTQHYRKHQLSLGHCRLSSYFVVPTQLSSSLDNFEYTKTDINQEGSATTHL